MLDSLLAGDLGAQFSALLQVLMIDLVLAGDNAVAVGLAAAGLPADQRRKAILYGLIAAVTMRIGFALITAQLLGIVGLLFAGGLLDRHRVPDLHDADPAGWRRARCSRPARGSRSSSPTTACPSSRRRFRRLRSTPPRWT